MFSPSEERRHSMEEPITLVPTGSPGLNPLRLALGVRNASSASWGTVTRHGTVGMILLPLKRRRIPW